MAKHEPDSPADRSGEPDEFNDVVSALRRVPPPVWHGDLTDRVMARVRPQSAWRRSVSSILPAVTLRPAVWRWAASIVILLGLAVAMNAHRAGRIHPQDRLQTALRESAAWLSDTQEPGGSWNPQRWGGRSECTVGLTAMSALALLRSPTPGASAAVSRAAAYLSAQQQPDGQVGAASAAAMYNHALAAVALLEASRSGQAAVSRDVLRAATAFICRRQLPSGGWGYRNDAGAQANTGVSVWQLQALALAAKAGLLADNAAYRRGLLWLKSMMNDQGQFGYQRQGPGEASCGAATLTAMGAYCLFALAPGTNDVAAARPELAGALAAAAATQPGPPDYYRWYFASAACEASQDARCLPLRAGLRQRLLDNRVESGQYRGTWEPTGPWSQVGGRLLTTTLAALSL